MVKKTRLPYTEFTVMKAVWASETPVSANTVMDLIGNEKGWKVQTAITLLNRLLKRKFLRTEKHGKERVYYPIINRDDYLRFETGNFLKLYHENSFASFITTLYDGKSLNEDDIKELAAWIKEKGK